MELHDSLLFDLKRMGKGHAEGKRENGMRRGKEREREREREREGERERGGGGGINEGASKKS